MKNLDKIYNYIADKYFMLAIIEIRNIINKYPEKVYLYDSLNDIDMVFRQMVQYKISGVVDPQQDSIVYKISNDLFDILDELQFHSNTVDFINQKNIKVLHVINQYKSLYLSENIKEDQLLLLHDIFIQILFEDKPQNIIPYIKQILFENDTDIILKQMVCSAVMLRLFLSFNKNLFLLIVESVIKESNSALKTRLYTAFIFVLIQYYSRIIKDRELINGANMILFEESHRSSIIELLKTILKSVDTRRIYDKIQNGLLKEVAKFSSEMKNSTAVLDDDNNLNPKWIDIVENKDIAEKVREFQDLQLEGSDVYFVTFSTMKFFSFFNELPNWFLPFIPSHPSLTKTDTDKNTIDVFSKMEQFCDSDKYSLFLGLSQFPKNMIDSILSQSGGDLDMLKEDQVGEEWKNKLSLSKNPSIARSYIQDLYRFFTCSSFGHYFLNPFDNFVTFFSQLNDNILFDINIQREIADKFFDIEKWDVCNKIYLRLENQNNWDLFFYQRFAFSYQKLKCFSEAIDIYKRAELIDEKDIWSLRQRAFCSIQINDINSAIDCYTSILAINENNVAVLIKLAGCYSILKRYEEEKNILYKVDFVTENNTNVKKSLGWTLLLLGEKENAYKYYKELYQKNLFVEEDYQRAGFVFLVNNDTDKAIELCTKYLKYLGNNNTFIDSMKMSYQQIKQYITLEDYILFVNQIFMNI